MPQTEAQKRAQAKYEAKTYKMIACKCKLKDYPRFMEYGRQQGITSASSLIYRALEYCADNNIDLGIKDGEDK